MIHRKDAAKEFMKIMDETKGDKMKMIVESSNAEGLDLLLGETVTLFCQIYIYTGKLVGVNESFVKLQDAKVVYETGAFDDKSWKDAQALPHEWYVQKNAIESFGKLK